MKRRHQLTLLIATLTILVAFTPVKDRIFSIAQQLEIFSELFKVVNQEYVDELNPNEVIRKGMDSMLDQLDPYTNYYSEDMVEDIRTQRTGQYAGIGVTTKRFNQKVKIIEVIENSPAAKMGLTPGDEIIKIDGVELSNLGQEETDKLMRGQAGNLVKLVIQKFNQPTNTTLELKREKIQLKTVSYSGMIDSITGYILLDEFGGESASEIRSALLQLKEKGAKQLVLDLRGNPGGLLDQAVSICSLFLPKGSLVVINKGKNPESNLQYQTRTAPMEPDMPLAILIDRSSASASEIVAGTMQDYDRGIVIGERSYGKGLVQTRRALSFNSFTMVTTAKYYTPSGRCIQALDYSNRRADGSVDIIPDSLKKTFQTKNGRKVFDGGGIDPDIKINRDVLPEIIRNLQEKGQFLDYAISAQKDLKIKEAKEFSINDQQVDQFISWIYSKGGVEFNSDLEKRLQQMEKLSQIQQVQPAYSASIADLKSGLKRFRQRQLKDQREELKKLLSKEITLIPFYKKGSIEASFKYDQELKTALEILKNDDRMNQILARKSG